jgi:hypothetical protein
MELKMKVMKHIITLIAIALFSLVKVNAQYNVLPFGVSLCGAEFGVENLAFKLLRNAGLIQKLYDAEVKEVDKELSLDEGNQFTGALAKARAKGLSEFTVGGKTFKVKNSKKIVKEAELTEKWSRKYKRSIDCSHPKGFSQKAHCAGRRKKK